MDGQIVEVLGNAGMIGRGDEATSCRNSAANSAINGLDIESFGNVEPMPAKMPCVELARENT